MFGEPTQPRIRSEKYGKTIWNLGLLQPETASKVVPGYAAARTNFHPAGDEPEELEDAVRAHRALLGTGPDVQMEFT